MPSGIRLPSLTMTFRSEPSGFADKTWPLLALKKYKRPEPGFVESLTAFALEFTDDIEFFPSFLIVPICFSVLLKPVHSGLRTATAQTSLTLRSSPDD